MGYHIVASIILFTILMIVIITYCPNHHETNQYQLCFTRKEGFANVKVGDNFYKVHEDLENPTEAAQTMDRLNTVAHSLIDTLQAKYIKGSSIGTIKNEYRDIVKKGVVAVKNNFKTANLQENLPARSDGDTSYVIDKGTVFAMCLRDPKNLNKVDGKFNDLTFVLVHEIAHLFCREWGHSPLFWENFKFLLQEASDANLYSPIDYKKTGSPYCGIVISYSPLFDKSLKSYYQKQ